MSLASYASVIRGFVLVPILASGFGVVPVGPSVAGGGLSFVHYLPVPPSFPVAHQEVAVKDSNRPSRDELHVLRRLRIERILLTLDRLAEVVLQMSPHQATRLEPVLVDLAERTIELTDVDYEPIGNSSIEGELDLLEGTVQELVLTLERMVEPEMTL